MLKHTFVILILVCSLFPLSVSAAWQNDTLKINWLSWEEAVALNEIKPRKIVMEVYTDWCIWCKRMDGQTLSKESIIKYINENYYAVKFDAEQRTEIKYGDKVYKFVKSGRTGYHELAAELLKGRLTFPTIVFMDEKMEVIQSIAGFKTPMQFMQIITYFGENRHQNTPFSMYKKSFVPPMTLIKNEDNDN